jgi:hypothetical protein
MWSSEMHENKLRVWKNGQLQVDEASWILLASCSGMGLIDWRVGRNFAESEGLDVDRYVIAR